MNLIMQFLVPICCTNIDDHYAENQTKTKMTFEMEAAIKLLSMLRQSNASLPLYNKIVKLTKQCYI